MTKLAGFPDGNKTYVVCEPEIIKKSNIELRKGFAIGALNFESGVGMKNQIEFGVVSKRFQEDLCEILEKADIKFHKMKKCNGKIWRLWSNTLTKQEIIKWMEVFEPQTEKWFKLYEAANGYQGKANSIIEALTILDKVYPPKQASKTSLKRVLLALIELKETHRYKLADYLAKEAKLESFGGKWAHGLKHYLDILKAANIISIKLRRFGKKKSFGTIIRQVYIFNPKVSEWRVPLRNLTAASGVEENQVACSLPSTI